MIKEKYQLLLERRMKSKTQAGIRLARVEGHAVVNKHPTAYLGSFWITALNLNRAIEEVTS